jgi:hypothetical protein
MARGFDSKSVTEQQEEAERRRNADAQQKTIVSAKRRQLELARIDLVRRMETAPERYRESLQRALEALDEQLKNEHDPGRGQTTT